jgi:hypothetical protein
MRYSASEKFEIIELVEHRTNANKGERRSGAPGRTRTSTMFPPPDFESGFRGFLVIPVFS